MDVWITVLGFALFLGFMVAVMVCIAAIKKKGDIIIKSRLHHKVTIREVVSANIGLIVFVILLWFKMYTFVPGILAFVTFVILSTRVQSGLTKEGALIGTMFIEWEFMKGYKLVDDPSDSNIIILKIRANHKQYVLVCNREDRMKIAAIMDKFEVKATEVVSDIDSAV